MMIDSGAAWDRLHRQERFRPRYPSEAVVRFVAGYCARGQRVLDLGCGAGRHLTMLADLGRQAVGTDQSMVGLRYAYAAETLRKQGAGVARVAQAQMQALPFADASFDAAIAYGVLYYADAAGYQAAVRELWRVLRPGAHLFVVTRSTDDRRAQAGPWLEERTVFLGAGAGAGSGTGEAGMVMHFLDRAAIGMYFAAFSEVQVDRVEHEFGGGSGARDVDWLINAVR